MDSNLSLIFIQANVGSCGGISSSIKEAGIDDFFPKVHTHRERGWGEERAEREGQTDRGSDMVIDLFVMLVGFIRRLSVI